MNRALYSLGLLLIVGMVTPCLGWAQTVDPSSTAPIDTGAQALQLTQNLYCSIKTAFTSPTAMFVGLAMAVAGLWKLIQGNVGGGLVLIIVGALLGALPTLAESMLNGIGGAIGSMTSSPTITPPSC